MWNNDWESARDLNVGAIGTGSGRSQGRGSKLSPERHYSFWGWMNSPGITEKKSQKGRRETSTGWNTFATFDSHDIW